MRGMRLVALSVAGALIAFGPQIAAAQHHHNDYQFDHHDHVIRDSHGHVIGTYHHDVIRPQSTYIVPHDDHHHGSYYYDDHGHSYYVPHTVNSDAHHHETSRPVAIEYGSFSHVDDLASRLETLTNDLCWDMHYNYSHNPGFRATYREMYTILETARFIHAAEHLNDRDAIAGKLGGLDALFHHVEEDVHDWTRHEHRRYGNLGLHSKMDLVESTLHHLMNDVGVKAQVIDDHDEPQAPQPESAPQPLPQ